MIASPSNRATVPPYLVTEEPKRAKAPFMISATCSGSSLSPSPVESTTSAKNTVTYLRSPSTRAGASSWLPQFRQNLALAGLVVWQWGQFISQRLTRNKVDTLSRIITTLTSQFNWSGFGATPEALPYPTPAPC